MIRWWTSTLQLVELAISSLVHLGYGFYIFSSAVAGDLSQSFSDCVYKPNVDSGLKSEGLTETTNNVNVDDDDDDLPPIVLVHGIFGFGKGVHHQFATFASSFFFFLFWFCLLVDKMWFFKIDLQRLGGLSYFAGAEKKDDRVLVPDLGSLTSVYDRFVLQISILV